jgi:hypothetical protein
MNNFRVFGMCLNWKVLAGLAMVGVGIWLLAPGVVGAALPFLLVLACPLSMLLMLGQMGQGRQGNQGMACGEPGASGNTQMDQERASSVVALTPDEHLVELRARLEGVQAEQAAILRKMAALEAVTPPTPAAPEALSDESASLAASS